MMSKEKRYYFIVETFDSVFVTQKKMTESEIDELRKRSYIDINIPEIGYRKEGPFIGATAHSNWTKKEAQEIANKQRKDRLYLWKMMFGEEES